MTITLDDIRADWRLDAALLTFLAARGLPTFHQVALSGIDPATAHRAVFTRLSPTERAALPEVAMWAAAMHPVRGWAPGRVAAPIPARAWTAGVRRAEARIRRHVEALLPEFAAGLGDRDVRHAA